MNRIFFGPVLLVAAFAIAPEAKACFECCVPPPYAGARCCSSICGSTGCEATSSGWSSFCAATGGTCASNEEYCATYNKGPRHKDVWVSCEPPLSEKWRLVAVRITRTPLAKAASKS